MTTANYTDVGLTADMIASLKKTYRRSAWRMKIQKSDGLKTFEADTATSVKIDAQSTYPLQTDGDNYRKIINDKRTNRSFILHYNQFSTGSAIVSIINHDLETTDADYIETIDNTITGWPTEYDLCYANDMAYDPVNQLIAIASTGTTNYCPPLIIVDVKKSGTELKANYCSTLDDNPDYLTVTDTFTADKSYHYWASQSYHKFVVFNKGYWYTWTRVFENGNDAIYTLWMMGRFSASGTYTRLFQYGWAPGEPYGPNRPDGGSWAAEIMYPVEPRWSAHLPDYDTPLTGTTDGYFCDPTAGLSNVMAMKFSEDGTNLILATSPDTNKNIYHDTYKFGMEPMIFRFSLADMISEASWNDRVIDTKTITLNSELSFGFQRVLKAYTTATSTDMIDNLNGCPWVAVHAVPDTIGSGSVLIEGDLGVSRTISASTLGVKNQAFGDQFCIGDTVKYGIENNTFDPSASPYSVTFTFTVFKRFPGLVEVVGVHSNPRLIQPTDTDYPLTVDGTWTVGAHSYTLAVAKKAYASSSFNTVRDIHWSKDENKYAVSMWDYHSGLGRGLYIYKTITGQNGLLKILNTTSTPALPYDYVGSIQALADAAVFLGQNSPTSTHFWGDTVALQCLNLSDDTLFGDIFTGTLGFSTKGVLGAYLDTKHLRIGFITGIGYGGSAIGGEIWFYEAPLVDGVWKYDRDMRKWWDGSNPDITMGATGDSGGILNQLWTFESPQFSSQKGTASNSFTFDLQTFDYLPWNETSEFNQSVEAPGVYDGGTLADGNRIVLERGVFLHGVWNWLQEGTFFVTKSPAVLESGLPDLSVTSSGVTNMLVTRGIYKGTHRPTEQIYTRVTLTTDDNLTYVYNNGTSDITDWCPNREIVIYVDGVQNYGYTLTSASGLVTFPNDMTGKTVEATFSAYVSGTNEAEDIIKCILQYPNDLGGCELDDSWFTRIVSGETPTTTDHLTYTFAKNNVVDSDAYNTVYRDGTPITSGFTWNYRNGTITFGADQSAYVITVDYKHYTLQKSGATLRPITFHPRKQKSSYDCINEVCRRVAPNYILREGRDGKIECDFYTQKTAANADLTITTSSDVILNNLSIDPAYEGLATRVISFGQAELDDLPNYCLGKTVTDLWTYGWHAGIDVQVITDGDPSTGATGGYGGWSDGTYDVQTALIASGVDGLPLVSVDMEDTFEVDTIIIARSSQAAGEGERGAVQAISIWVSNDDISYTRIVDETEIGPGQNVKYVAGTNFDEGTTFRYIRLNLHSLGLYTGPDGDTDSQISISEIQCYPSKTIEGVAELQDDDPTAAHYDTNGLLEKYGFINYIARGGEPDSMLYTQELADEDAGFVLDEVIRLISKVEIRAPWIPALPIYSTIRVIDVAMGTDNVYFVESRSAGDDDTFTGATLP